MLAFLISAAIAAIQNRSMSAAFQPPAASDMKNTLWQKQVFEGLMRSEGSCTKIYAIPQ